MSFNAWQKEISDSLEVSLNKYLPNNQFKEVVKYSVFPTGKLFRPLLVYSLAKDLGDITANHSILAQAIELHHTYTLIHDDLPAMDDDDVRRNRPSAHKKFNEWNAILSGDSLLNISYEVLANIAPEFLPEIIKEFSKHNGPRGLILGQVMDLNNENESINQILKLHELKTGRLIQLSLIGSAILSRKKEIVPDLIKLGKSIGLNFQLLDDLCEFTEEINQHEKEINPFIHLDKSELLRIVFQNNEDIIQICKKLKLTNLKEYIDLYMKKIKTKLENDLQNINKYVELTKLDLEKL